jgi:hypothetical protein
VNPQVAAVLADTLVLVHLLFVAFVLAGGLLLLRWPRLAWIHLPAATWGAAIEFAGGICPLTPLETTLRAQAGEAAYRGGFVEHYLLTVLYPAQLTPAVQLWLGGAVVVVNLAIYVWVWRARRRDQSGWRSRP